MKRLTRATDLSEKWLADLLIFLQDQVKKKQPLKDMDETSSLTRKHTQQELHDRIMDHVAKGESLKARYILTVATNLRSQDRKDVSRGLRPLALEEIVHTDLTNLKKAGCTVGAAALFTVVGVTIYQVMSSFA
jgi:hypothetical protein